MTTPPPPPRDPSLVDLNDPGIEDTHAEHLPNGDAIPPVGEVAPADAEGDVSGELPPDGAAPFGGLHQVDVD